MKKIFIQISICMLVASVMFARQAKYVVLVSIDGLRPDFYLDSTWQPLNLMYLKSNGVYAKGVRGVFPTVTYPSHTTIITGAKPARHGIYYNTIFESQHAGAEDWYWQYRLIKTKTIFDAAHQAGLTTAAISWPVTVGAPIDHIVPEIWSNDKNISRLSIIKENTSPKNFFEELEQNATGKIYDDDLNADYLRIDDNSGRIAAYLIKQYKPNLLAVHFVCVDHYEHKEGRNGEGVHKALAAIDRGIGNILEAIQQANLQDSTAIIITGDHGFSDVHQTLAPNVWLAENGLLSKDNWKAKFHVTGGSAFLMLKDKNDKNTLAQVQKILKELPIQYQLLFRVVDKKELDEAGADPHAMLALSPVLGTAMNGSMTGDALKPFKGGTHGYFPETQQLQTGFIGYGPMFNKGLMIPQMGLEDIAPLISQMLDLHFKAKDGSLQEGILKK